jgi:hypothetical protein
MNYPTMQQNIPTTQNVMQNQNVNWIPVSGIQGARDHIVQPNQTAWMMDNNEPVFYVKKADSFGTTEFKAYRFEEITDAPQAPQINSAQFVTRAEFDELKAKIDKLSTTTKQTAKTANKEA